MPYRWLHYKTSLLVLAEFDSLALYDDPLVFTLDNLNGYQAFFLPNSVCGGENSKSVIQRSIGLTQESPNRQITTNS